MGKCKSDEKTIWTHWEPGQKEELAREYAAGKSVEELALKHKRKPSNIRTVLHNLGACVRQKRANRRNEARILRLVEKGLTDSQISRKTKFCRSTVQRVRLASGKRKYKDAEMGEDGWPLGLIHEDRVILKLIEQGLDGTTVPWLAGMSGNPIQAVEKVLAKLIERKHVKKRGSGVHAIYLLTPRVKNMRRNFSLSQNG